MKKIGLVSDIEKAFLQVGLHEADRDVTRFLWLKDIQKPVSKDNLLVCRFKRLPFGIISSPFLLRATIKHHLEKENSATSKNIKNDFYVDNLISGADNKKDAVRLYRDAKRLFEDVSMNLREWLTNSPKVINQIKPKDQIEERVTKVLGLVWNTNADELSISTKKLEIQQPATTKREVLTTLASLYDPLGMLTPFTINMKIFIQNLWEKGLDWDDKLDDKDKETWKKMTQDIHKLSSIQIPRFIGNGKSQLLCFCDSSNKAYAAAIYLRVVGSGKVSVNLLLSKSRNAPKRKPTVPRLELMSSLIGVRNLRFVANEMKLNDNEKILWTDSQYVLSWLKQKENKDTF